MITDIIKSFPSQARFYEEAEAKLTCLVRIEAQQEKEMMELSNRKSLLFQKLLTRGRVLLPEARKIALDYCETVIERYNG